MPILLPVYLDSLEITSKQPFIIKDFLHNFIYDKYHKSNNNNKSILICIIKSNIGRSFAYQ